MNTFSGGVSYNENDAGDVDDYPLNCFNDDLLCEHGMSFQQIDEILNYLVKVRSVNSSSWFIGQLKVEESSRRLVLPAVWQKLKFYFPSAPEFLGTDPICRDCKV